MVKGLAENMAYVTTPSKLYNKLKSCKLSVAQGARPY